jgi:hypothetical protein
VPSFKCKGYSELQGIILQERYEVGAQIDAGTQGRVFEITDLQRREGSTTELCIKFSENYKVLTHEIRTISRMRKVFKKSRDEKNTFCGYPSMKTYGMINFIDTSKGSNPEP